MMPDENNPKLYELWRMLPPGKHKYFYSVGNIIQVAKDQPQGDGTDKNLQKPEFLDLTRLELPGDIAAKRNQDKSQSNSSKKSPTTRRNKNTQRQMNESSDSIKIVPDFYEMLIEKVNVIENIAATKTIYSSKIIRQMIAVPRPGEKFLGKRDLVRTPWDFSLSCFKTYKPDTAKLMAQCFDLDWERMRLPRAIKDDERDDLKEYLRPRYKHFRDVYKYQAGIDP